MSETFEFFEGARSESTAPQVTVRRSGQMVLTSAAVALLGDDATHVQFGYDPGRAVVAIRKAPEETRGRYRLRRQLNGSSLADGRRFFAHHGLKVEKARTFDAEPLGDGMVGFQLDEPEPEAQAAAKAVETKPAETKSARGGKAKERAAA
jgi:hypothetical protein